MRRMSRLPAAALALALVASPLLTSCAHDPLDDVDGQKELEEAKGPVTEEKAHGGKKERQEAELKREQEELEALQADAAEQKEQFLRDKEEFKEVLAAQHTRDVVSGRKSNTGPPTPSAPTPKSDKSEDKAPAKANDSGSGSGSSATVTHTPKKGAKGDETAKRDTDTTSEAQGKNDEAVGDDSGKKKNKKKGGGDEFDQ
jgi:hypothetical protein